jgi:hypothetical protein
MRLRVQAPLARQAVLLDYLAEKEVAVELVEEVAGDVCIQLQVRVWCVCVGGGGGQGGKVQVRSCFSSVLAGCVWTTTVGCGLWQGRCRSGLRVAVHTDAGLLPALSTPVPGRLG